MDIVWKDLVGKTILFESPGRGVREVCVARLSPSSKWVKLGDNWYKAEVVKPIEVLDDNPLGDPPPPRKVDNGY